MARFRYSLSKGHDFKNYDIISQIKRRLKLYEDSKNIEHLVDCYNFVRIEYLKARELGYHFKSIDDGEHATKRSN
jgi:hypothetical protein